MKLLKHINKKNLQKQKKRKKNEYKIWEKNS